MWVGRAEFFKSITEVVPVSRVWGFFFFFDRHKNSVLL